MKPCKYCGGEHPNTGNMIIPSCVDVLIDRLKAGVASGRKVYLLIEHGDGNDPSRIHICAGADERRKKTREAIAGSDTYDKQMMTADIATLETDKWLRFEGDPPLQWVDGVLS